MENKNMNTILADVETTGTDDGAKVVELAWYELTPEMEIVEKVHSLIDPEIPIPSEASGVHHITNEMVADSPTIEQFFEMIRPGKIPGSIIFCAYNSPFDRKFVEPWCEEIVMELDLLRAARKLFPNLSNHKLQTLRYEFKLDAGKEHSALGDVHTCYSFLKYMFAHPEIRANTLDELAAELLQPFLLEVMPFGKHRGTKFSQMPKGYLEWMLSPRGITSMDQDLKYTVEYWAEH